MDASTFRTIKYSDLAKLPPDTAKWIVSWETDMGHDGILREHHGREDLATYMNAWNKDRFSHYFDADPALVEASFAVTRKVYQRLEGADVALPSLEAPLPVDHYNAEDYVFQNAYPVPRDKAVKRILDFGAGYGRQVNIWSQKAPDLVYCAIDAIENAYCCQNLYYALGGTLPVHEYMDGPGEFAIGTEPGIYHLPTWRHDLIPDDFFDLVTCVQVLPELQEPLVRLLVEVFRRSLKIGGALYIRDHDLLCLPGHRLDLDRLLPQAGFRLEFRPYLKDFDEIHGIPRMWRKIDPGEPYRKVDPVVKEPIKSR